MASASELERLTACPASAVIGKASYTGEAALKGTSNHEDIELGIETGNYIDLPPVVSRVLFGAERIECEVAYAIDVEKETVRKIGKKLGRKYGVLSESEIALTVDVTGLRHGDPFVYDWKSRKRVTPAPKNLQIRAGAVAVMRDSGASTCLGALCYLDDGEVDSYNFDAFDAAMFFEDMRQLLNKIGAARLLAATGTTPPVSAGPWCEYCPAMAYCPAQTRQALAMLGDLGSLEQQVAFMTEEQVGKAWEKKKQIEAILERVDASLRLRAQQGVIPLSNGKRLALVDKTRRSFNKDRALTRIHELGGETSDLYKTTSYSQIAEVNMKDKEQTDA
jgi:hypothetical protein